MTGGMTLLAFLRHMAFCAVLACLSAVVVRAMIAARVMDQPDPRKAHRNPTPRGGGVGVVVAFMLGIGVLYGFAEFARLADPYFRGMILSAALIAAVSFVDDVRDLPFTAKLAAQALAATAAIASGLYVQVYNLPLIGPVDIGWWGMGVTLVWILFATNAMNFIDGLNGLAAGTAFVAALFLAAIALTQGGMFVYFASLLLAAGLAGFLPFNFPTARIFIGDVGAQFCGFILAVLGIAASRFGQVELSFLLVPMLLHGVLFDVAFTLVRRLLAGENITQAHRGHLYQIAHRAGMDARAIAVLHWGFAALGGLAAIAFTVAPWWVKLILPVLLLAVQIAWALRVAAMARRADLGRW
jgi:UDP-GlcNAc:undecaprenyl-phosphate GlcNAc-1-phosphate transferase